MNIIHGMRLSRLRTALIAVVLAVAGLLVSASQIAPAGAVAVRAPGDSVPKPAIVLEHGAWAAGSSWTGEIRRLQRDGFTVYAPPNPLSGLANDSATLADFLSTITGPIILVGHSYGGMVITNAATGNPNVKALVYVDAFVPAKGETAFGLTAAQPGSCVGSANAFTAVPYPGALPGTSTLTSRRAPTCPTRGSRSASPTACPPARPPSWLRPSVRSRSAPDQLSPAFPPG